MHNSNLMIGHVPSNEVEHRLAVFATTVIDHEDRTPLDEITNGCGQSTIEAAYPVSNFRSFKHNDPSMCCRDRSQWGTVPIGFKK